MKKYIAILLIVTIAFTCACVLCACETGEELTLYVPDGAPALSVAKIINDGKVGNHKVTTTVTKGGNEIVAKCASGEADMAVLPTNAAVNVMKKNSDYLLFSVNVYGVLYVVGTEQISNLSDLVGQRLYSIGLTNTPELVFKTICDTANVSYVNVDDSTPNSDGAINILYKEEASDVIPFVLNKTAKFALIGEPAVTQLKNKAAEKNVTIYDLFDLQQLWQEATGSNELGYPQASLIVKKDLLTNGFAAKLLAALQANNQFAKSHLSSLNAIMRGAGSSLDLNYTEDLLNRCNLTAIPASSAVEDLNKYLAKFNLQLDADKIYNANND
ncbi:MAG: hypothetical protein J1F65_04215 [Clostridiales bacterium]|nr:hypothetical protein [Clostridiales bacterium]